ncbi:hypothetical protein M407DRAFT_34384 [Tulasnella calospora MUT 4182]|uniref:Uncharacterized protein n=1 Tax=Tulasnella calospora MUT 4182 TaxID=1051891 RepID=A0A0C3L2N4_9AGAM|nr:hypothetical protein M407DRAFT_34384 [Tulasnella calospora MUT 4182]
MPPARSDASVAAAPAVTRSGRVKRVSKAALTSVANENREAQQSRRSRTGGKSVRRNGANARGQTVATGTPTVSISNRTANIRKKNRD